MKIHLVVIDLDGTLLNSAKQISDATVAILQKARKTGVKIVLATARPPRSVMPFYTQLNLDTPMINYNGALVYDPCSSRILMHRPIARDLAQQIVASVRRQYPQVLVSAEIMDKWYTDRVDERFATETARQHKPDVVGPLEEWLTVDVTKLLLLGKPERISEVMASFHKEFTHMIAMVQTEGYLLQIMHATVSKAQALRVVAHELGVSREQVMAIGDNANDVAMLQWAGIGVAMDNAPPAVKAVADYITDHHDADGAAKAIHNIIVRGLDIKKRGSSHSQE